MVMVVKEGPLEMTAVIAAMEPRPCEMIGANIALQLNLEREGLWVKADARLIEQIVLNLISQCAGCYAGGWRDRRRNFASQRRSGFRQAAGR